MPCPIIKPVPEIIESMRDKILRRSKVEPRVNYCMVSCLKGIDSLLELLQLELRETRGLTFVDDTLESWNK